jgi:flavodoxin
MQKLLCVLALAFMLAGCGTKKGQTPGGQTGGQDRILVIYSSQKADAKRVAKIIAQETGGDLFDLQGRKAGTVQALPDPLEYDIFFVGAPLEAGQIAQTMETFLSQTDFWDGVVVPFWTTQDDAKDMRGDFEERIQGARIFAGIGFAAARRVKTKVLKPQVGEWVARTIGEIKVQKAVGERAEDVMKAFAAAYSGRFSPAEFRNGDWVLEMDGAAYYYAQGRLLREEDTSHPEDFRSLSIYRYSPDFSGGAAGQNFWRTLAEQTISRRRSFGYTQWGRPSTNPGAGRSAFYEAIWQAHTREESLSRQRSVVFLGKTVQVHQGIIDPLGRVEESILSLAESDEEVREWLKSLRSISGWNWRNIAGSQTRSFHAYGVALDLQVAPQTGMETYWQWTAAKGVDWRSVPSDKRQNPPSPVIEAFEAQGFAWGGKWHLYDTMHFEYRPEIMVLAFK